MNPWGNSTADFIKESLNEGYGAENLNIKDRGNKAGNVKKNLEDTTGTISGFFNSVSNSINSVLNNWKQTPAVKTDSNFSLDPMTIVLILGGLWFIFRRK